MMPRFAVNHRSLAWADYQRLLMIAKELDLVGIEVRNDLSQPVFDGLCPVQAGQMARDGGQRLLAVAEVKRFNDWSDDRAAEADALITIARQAGAEAIGLVPRNDNLGMGNGERQARLRLALKELVPMLAAADLIGLIEPLGYRRSSLRSKQEAVDVIEGLGFGGRIKLIHDTFHHAMAGGPLFAEHTGLVHLSGVTDPVLAMEELQENYRTLVDRKDRIGAVEQILSLTAAGYDGPLSIETPPALLRSNPQPAIALQASIAYIRSELAAAG